MTNRDDDGREMKLVNAPPDAPTALLQKACHALHDGDSVFSMVLAIGCYTVRNPSTGAEYPQVAAASCLNNEKPEALALLASKLRTVLGDLDRLVATSKQTPS